MGYCLGVKKNTKTDTIPENKGRTKTLWRTVTPGGAFPEAEGVRLGETPRKQVFFFTLPPECKNKLQTQKVTLDFLHCALTDYSKTITAYLVYTYQLLLTNHCLLVDIYFMVKFDKDYFQKLLVKFSNEDFRAIQELESVTQLLFACSANDSQEFSIFTKFLLP